MTAVGSSTSAIFGALGSPQIETLLAAAPLLELDADAVLTPAEFENECLLVVEDGLAILRAEHPGTGRGIVTCHAGPGVLILPPRDGETLRTLVPTRVTVVTAEVRDRLFEIRGVAALLFAALAATLRQKHQTIATL